MTDVQLSPGVLHYTIVQGDDFYDTWTFAENSVAMNLSAYTFAAKLDGPALTSPVSFTIGTSSAANGILVVSLTDVQTAALATGRYDWDFQWTDGNTRIRTVLAGRFTVLDQTTT